MELKEIREKFDAIQDEALALESYKEYKDKLQNDNIKFLVKEALSLRNLVVDFSLRSNLNFLISYLERQRESGCSQVILDTHFPKSSLSECIDVISKEVLSRYEKLCERSK